MSLSSSSFARISGLMVLFCRVDLLGVVLVEEKCSIKSACILRSVKYPMEASELKRRDLLPIVNRLQLAQFGVVMIWSELLV